MLRFLRIDTGRCRRRTGSQQPAFVNGTDPDGGDVPDDDTDTEPARVPAINLVKTASAIDLMLAGPTDRADVGDQITYSFSIENTGNVTLDTVELDDALVNFAGESCNDIDGILAPGETTNCTAVYNLTQTDIDNGSIANTATTYGNPPAGTRLTVVMMPATVTVPPLRS